MPMIRTTQDERLMVVEVLPGDQSPPDEAFLLQLRDAWAALEDTPDLIAGVLHLPDQGRPTSHSFAVAALPDGSPDCLPLMISKPVIAAVDGQCHGFWFELALACDLRVAAADAVFSLPPAASPEARYRVASVLLPRMTFMGASLQIALAGQVITADEARAMRIVNRVISAGGALPAATDAAKLMIRRFPDASSFRKQQIWSLSGVPLPHAMTTARRI